MSAPKTRHLTILLTDIKGFTDKTSHKSRTQIQEMLDTHRELVLPTLEGKGGRLIKTIGDAFLMAFESPTDAVLAGVSAQESLRAYNKDRVADDRIEVRIAINAGEVNLADNDVFGEPVNITARIEGIAEPGEVFFTEAVYLAMNKTEVPSAEVGLLQLKGIPEKVRVYKVKREVPVGQNRAAAPAAAQRSASPVFPEGEKAVFASAEKPAPPPGERPRLTARFVALAVDFLLCTLLAGLLAPKTGGSVRYTGKAPDSAAALAQGRVEYQEDGLEVKVGPKGDVEVTVDGDRRGGRAGKAAFPLVWVLYNALFLGFFGATPGKMAKRLRVVPAESCPLQWKHAVARAVSSLLSGYVVLLGYLWAWRQPEQRTWHDLIAGTRVVRSA